MELIDRAFRMVHMLPEAQLAKAQPRRRGLVRDSNADSAATSRGGLGPSFTRAAAPGSFPGIALAAGERGTNRASGVAHRTRLIGSRAQDAAEADVAAGGVDGFGFPGCRPVAQAVVGGAEVGAAFDDPSRYVPARGSYVVAVIGGFDAGVARCAARVLGLVRRGPEVEVTRPLPHVPGHVVEAVAVGREGFYR